MAKKSYDAAVRDAVTSVAIELEYQRRHPDFVAGIKSLNQMPFGTRKELAARQKASEEFLKKWKLPIVLPIASEITFDKVFVRLPIKGSLSWRSNQRISDLNDSQEWIAAPVIVVKEEDDTGFHHPLDDLAPLVDNMYRRLKRAARVPGRRRLDAAEFQLKVFDLAGCYTDTYKTFHNSGHPRRRRTRRLWTFAEIAAELRKQTGRHVTLSTVKMAYLQACRRIGVLPSKRRHELTKLSLHSFDWQKHSAECAQCQDAERSGSADDLCETLRFFVSDGETKKHKKEIYGLSTENRSSSIGEGNCWKDKAEES